MRDSDIDSLSADGAQDTERMHPRAALAEAVMNVETSQYPGAAEYGAGLADYLAERGVLLVTEERLAVAIRTIRWWDLNLADDLSAAIFAALRESHD